MTKFFFSLIFLFTSFVNFSKARFLSLPHKYKDWNVYHVSVLQLPEWSCGYNALYNAANFENHLNLKNSSADYKNFSKICLSYLNIINCKSLESSSHDTMLKLAKDLSLSKHYYIDCRIANRSFLAKINPFRRDSKKSQPVALDQTGFKKSLNKVRQEVYNYFVSKKGKLACVHFICGVFSRTNHAILATLVKAADGTLAVFIFDNTNAKITEKSDVNHFLDYLCKNDFISKKTFVKDFPVCWPTFPGIENYRWLRA